MMYKVNYTTPAEEDLISILEYISTILKAPSAAEKLLNEIEKHTGKIEENPFIFPLEKDEYLINIGIRHILIKNYFLFYTIEEDKNTVSIIRIIYARRDWINILKE